MKWLLRIIIPAATAILAVSASAQVTEAAGYTPPDDTPAVKLGATLFADYTYQQSPTSNDGDGNPIHPSAFNVTRAYLNITGNLNHRISFRVTPDITRESGTGSSLAGSYTFRLKYAFGQLTLDDWTTKGSWVRLGMQPTPFIDLNEGIYRYRFQGPVFEDREGYLSSSDTGLSGHWNFPGNYGDVQGGFFNGEGFNKSEPNNQKALQLRATVRPLPLGGVWKGLRLTAFIVDDQYVASASRSRVVGQVAFEHPRINAGFDYLTASDQTSTSKSEVKGRGYSIWATPRLGHGWELLLRHDELKPNTSFSQQRRRNIVGVAYWVPDLAKVTAAVMLDYDSLQQTNVSPSRADETRYGLKLLINF